MNWYELDLNRDDGFEYPFERHIKNAQAKAHIIFFVSGNLIYYDLGDMPQVRIESDYMDALSILKLNVKHEGNLKSSLELLDWAYEQYIEFFS